MADTTHENMKRRKTEENMDDRQVMHAMSLDDAYQVDQTLARGSGGVTELVNIGGTGPFVRKKSPCNWPDATSGQHSANASAHDCPTSKPPTNYRTASS